ncbi:MAG TPA: PEP-CTERM sorting domain-containing protein [Candidatus Angelobacter sp.]|nr:PEP-CTERM sorting domain-containing protein [Candidatus Angelobacter sp.]
MKKLLFTLACVFAVASAKAQGTVNFANTAGSLISYAAGVNGGAAVPTGQFTAELLYWATDPGVVNLNSSIAGLTSIKTSANFISAGRFIGGVATTPSTTAGGASAWFAVVAWQTSFGSYDAARAAGFYGYSGVFQNATGNPNSIPPGAAAAMTGFTGINNVNQVPEPSTIALGILGAAGLLLRRRK